MAKNAKESAQVKGRQTKLSKKSAEELIEIILRKDKTERNLNAQVVNLKAEVNSLTTRINNFDKDQEGNIKAISNWKKKYEEKADLVDVLNDKIVEKTAGLSKYENLYTEQTKVNVELTARYNSLKNLTWTIAGFTALCLIGWIFC